MVLTATKLRQNIYRLLDSVVETGIPVEIERKGKKLKIILEKPKSKLDNLEVHKIIKGNPEDIIQISHFNTWKKEPNL